MSYMPLNDYDMSFLPENYWDHRPDYDGTPVLKCKHCNRSDSDFLVVDADTRECTDCERRT